MADRTKATEDQKRATANFHERMARALRAAGREDDARAAEAAARKLRDDR